MSTRIGKMPVQTTTWPKSNKLYAKITKKTEGSSRRPETATLEKPLVLDPKLLRKIDMTTLSKEKLMSIQNLILPSKLRSKKTSGQSSWEDEDSSAVDEPKVKRFSKGLNTTYRIRSHVRKGLSELFPVTTQSPQNSRKLKTPEKISKDLTSKLKEKNRNNSKLIKPVSPKQILPDVVQDVVPPPCCTCGRPEQPERLHSHPARWQNRKQKNPRPSPTNEQENVAKPIVMQPKSSVRKPNPIKYRSGRTLAANQEPKPNPIVRKETFKIEVKKNDENQTPTKRKISHIPVIRRSPNSSSPLSSPIKTVSSLHSSPMKRSPAPTPPPVKTDRPSSSGRRPRTVVCHICMREFGTASLPLHEPHCLQRWERENSILPSHLQRPPPKKPDHPLTVDEWNEYAYAASQASLVPCEKCGRTFQPDRLPVHVKACIGIKRTPISPAAASKVKSKVSEPSILRNEDRLLEYVVCRQLWENYGSVGKEPCYLCGWMVPTNLLSNHEEACLAKWQSENDKLPPEKQKPLPLKPGQVQTSIPTTSTPRRRMTICYICGREFGSASIRIHEPQCLKKWTLENEKLPPEQRRSVPLKPEIVYKSDGQVDNVATDDAFWQSHLVQLVPCQKCGRKFNPDRVSVHEKACKGPPQNKH